MSFKTLTPDGLYVCAECGATYGSKLRTCPQCKAKPDPLEETTK